MSNYSLMACNVATGVYTQILPDYATVETSFEFSDVGGVKISYPKQGLNFATLNQDTRVEIAVLKDGVEMEDARFRLQVVEGDEVKDDDLPTFSGVSMLNRFKKAIIYSAGGSTSVATDQTFINATPGGILKVIFDQNKARRATSVCNEITYASFTSTTDSAGNPWAFSFGNITYTVGVNYLDIIRNMVDNGMIEVKMVGRDLRVYNAEGLGVDRTAGSSPVVLRKGLDFIEAPQTRTNEQIAGVALIEGDEEVLLQSVDSSVIAAWGGDEMYISQGGINDQTTLGVVAQNQLQLSSYVRAQRTRKIAVHQAIFQPYTDYRVSDYVFNDSGSGTGLEKLRIRQMVITIDQNGIQEANLVLNDKFLEREVAIARKISGILGGANAGGSVAVPVPSDPTLDTDTTTPNAPANLSATSAVYVNENGQSVAQSTLSWPASVLNTDGSTITDLDHYEVQTHTDQLVTATAPTNLAPGRDYPVLTRQFDRRGKPYGWLGADGGSSTPTVDGKTFWAFADTNIGTADQEGRVKMSTWSFVHNTFVLTDPNDSSVFDARWGYANKLSQDDAFLKTGLGFWQADANCTLSLDSTTSYYGAQSLKVTATAAGNAAARLAGGAFAYGGIVAGTTYSATARARSVGTARNVILAIRWYNASNTLISTTSGTSTAGSTTAWQKYTTVGVAPAGAVKAAILITFVSATASQTFNADTFMLCQGDARFFSWNDPGRNGLGGPIAIMCPEELGGAALTDFNDIFWTDTCTTANNKILVFYNRYTTSGTYKGQVCIGQFDGTTKQFESLTSFTTGETASNGVTWSIFTYADGTYLYVFGIETSGVNRNVHIMRVPLTNITGGTKEYRTGTGTWSTTRANSVAVMSLYAGYPGGVVKLGSTYYFPYTIYGEGVMRVLSTTDFTATGWVDSGPMYTMPNMGSGLVAYFARVHPQLQTPSGIPMSYSVNGSVQSNDSLKNIRYYAPKFLIGPPGTFTASAPTTPWSAITTIEAGTTTAYVGNLVPGNNFQARVRAADYNGNKSSWTASSPIKLVDDTTPPNQPSTPIISSVYQGIRIEWDGLDSVGGPPPGDWSSTEVHVSEIANFTPTDQTKVDTFITRLGGVSPLQGLEYGHTYYACFVMVDIRGNRSVASDVASTTPEQLVNTAEIADKLITGAKVADNAISVRSLTVAAFEPSIVPNGTFETEATDATNTGTGQPYAWSKSPWDTGASYTVALETANPISGSKSVSLTAATAADGGRYQSAVFPVTEGKLLAVSVKVRGSRAVALANAFEVHIVTGSTEANAGAYPSAGVSNWNFPMQASATTGVQTLELQRIVETGMKFARVFLSINASGDGSGWTGYFDDVIVAPVGGSAFIADASILNAKIANLAVNDAKISNLSVGKLTAGILSADVTVSARIKTADTGARVELNSAGFQAYDSANNQTVSIAASTGAATFTGTFQTDFDGSTSPHVRIQSSGDRTTIYFTDNSGFGVSAGNNAFMNTPADTGNAPRVGINTGAFYYAGVAARHRLFLNNANGIQLETYATGTGLIMGGRLSLNSGVSYLQHYLSSGTQTGGSIALWDAGVQIQRNGSGVANGGALNISDSAVRIGTYNTGTLSSEIALFDDETIWVTGQISDSNPIGGKAAIFAGYWNTSSVSGVQDFTVSYGSTMASTPRPLCNIWQGTTPGATWIFNETTTGFVMRRENTATSSPNWSYLCYRLG